MFRYIYILIMNLVVLAMWEICNAIGIWLLDMVILGWFVMVWLHWWIGLKMVDNMYMSIRIGL